MKRETQKIEAIKRLKMLNIYPATIEEFEKSDIVNRSEGIGILFWLSDKEKADVAAFEREHNALVYHVIMTNTEFGLLYSYLYVSKYQEEWKWDREDLKAGNPIVYVRNVDDEYCSEFGAITIQPSVGGLRRIW